MHKQSDTQRYRPVQIQCTIFESDSNLLWFCQINGALGKAHPLVDVDYLALDTESGRCTAQIILFRIASCRRRLIGISIPETVIVVETRIVPDYGWPHVLMVTAGVEKTIDTGALQQLSDPEKNVKLKNHTGGPGPDAVSRTIDGIAKKLDGHKNWLDKALSGIQKAKDKLEGIKRDIINGE